MRRGLALGLVACCTSAAACGVRIDGDRPTTDASQNNPDGRPNGPDASPDAQTLGPWGTPQLVPGASSTTAAEDDASLTSTTLEMVFAVVDPTYNNKDLYYMSRASTTSSWSAPVKLPFDTTSSEETPRFSDDDKTLYFASNRAGGLGGLDIYSVSHVPNSTTWGTPALVPGVNTTGTDKWFVPCPGTNYYMTILGGDIGEGQMGSAPTVCADLSSTSAETGTFMSRDCKTVYFASTRSMVNRIYVATRPAVGMPFNPPELVVDFLTSVGGAQEDPWLSPDGHTFVFVSDARNLQKDVYISTR
jgi:Tol biopolymer transport system component